MGAPQIILVALHMLALYIAIERHGMPQKPVNARKNIVATAIMFALLYWGGFFG